MDKKDEALKLALEALKETLKAHEVGVFMSGSGLDKARAAIAKAQGASQ